MTITDMLRLIFRRPASTGFDAKSKTPKIEDILGKLAALRTDLITEAKARAVIDARAGAQAGQTAAGSYFRAVLTASVKQSLAMVRVQQTLASGRTEELSAQSKSLTNEFAAADTTRRQFPMRYSYWLGFLLVLAAFPLFFSDVPLSLLLVGNGLQIPTEASPAGSMSVDQPEGINSKSKDAKSKSNVAFVRWTNAQTQSIDQNQADDSEGKWIKLRETGMVVSVTDILVAPWRTVSTFWDVYALALGIALLGIAMKPALDILLDPESFAGNRKRAEKVALLGVAAFLCTSLLVGSLRGEMLIHDLTYSLEQKVKELDKSLESDKKLAAINNKVDSNKVAASQGKRDSASSRLAGIKAQYGTARWAYIALTISLPVVAAICLHFGAHKVEHARSFSMLKRMVGDVNKELTLQLTDKSFLDGLIARLEFEELELNTKPDLEEIRDDVTTAYRAEFQAELQRLAEMRSGWPVYKIIRRRLDVEALKGERA